MAVTIPSFSRVKIGPSGSEASLTIDPQPYDPHNWPKRFAILKGLQGAVTIQDLGSYAKDLEISLRHNVLDNVIVNTISHWSRQRGVTYHFQDWLGNDFTVFIKSFTFQPHDVLTMSSYELTLQVTAINTWLGGAYGGS